MEKILKDFADEHKNQVSLSKGNICVASYKSPKCAHLVCVLSKA